ncbi:hypothetical protein GCM10023191_025570 [Actinoallomurus oryzae]|uniref:Uncharacterized protein n=1 Tax=Actinoallomurus oryzae TaxID=502180 RepID=A0ABP8PSS3_9ACTN
MTTSTTKLVSAMVSLTDHSDWTCFIDGLSRSGVVSNVLPKKSMTGGIADVVRPVNHESIALPTSQLTAHGGQPAGGGDGVTTGVGSTPRPTQCGMGSPGKICTLGQGLGLAGAGACGC